MSSSATSGLIPFPLSGRTDAEGSVTSPRQVAASALSDELLLSRVAEGDQESLVVLFRRHASLVRGIGQRLLRDAGEAEDLVQEVFLYLYRRAGHFDSSKSSARSWIVQIVYYQAIARRRYLASRHGHDHLNRQEECRGIPAEKPRDENRSSELPFQGAVVSEVLQSLTDVQRETLHLFFFEGYTLSEISAKLGQPAGNIRHHYYRGLDRLRTRLCAK